MPQFDSNLYSNPQMNNSSGPPAGWWNPQSQMTQWEHQWRPAGAAWQSGGEMPGSFGGETWWNPETGQTQTRSGDIISGYYGNKDAIYSVDPRTGERYLNTDAIFGGMGAGGMGEGPGYESYEVTPYGGSNIAPGEGYQGFDYSVIGSGIDPGAVIAAQEYKLQEGMEADMARAGARAGASGFAMSTPYMAELGSAARKAAQDRNALTMQYQYDAAQQQAQRDLAQQLQAGQLDFGGWQTGFQGDLQAQMANAQNAYNAWALQNQLGMQNTQGQNLYNQQQQQFGLQQQQMNANNMQNMLAMIMGMGG